MYNKILAAVDLSNDSKKVIDTAVRMAGNDIGKLYLVHVVEPVAAAYSMVIYAHQNSNRMRPDMDVQFPRMAPQFSRALVERATHTSV